MEKIISNENTQMDPVEQNSGIPVDVPVNPEEKDISCRIFELMEKIASQFDALMAAMQMIRELPVNDSPNGGFDGQARAEGIRSICAQREETNRKMLDMLKMMYEDQKTSRISNADRIAKYDWAGVIPQTAEVILRAMKEE